MSWRESTREAEGMSRGHPGGDVRVFVHESGWMVLRMGFIRDTRPWGVGCPIPGADGRHSPWRRRRFGTPEKAMEAVEKHFEEWHRQAKEFAIAGTAQEARRERSRIEDDLHRLRRIFERYDSVAPHYIESKLKQRMDELTEEIQRAREEKRRELEGGEQ